MSSVPTADHQGAPRSSSFSNRTIRSLLFSLLFSLAFSIIIAACGSSPDDTAAASTDPTIEDGAEADSTTPTTERLTAPMNVELVEENLRIQGFPADSIPNVIDCLDEQAQAEGLDFLAADSEEFAVFLVRCSPNFLASAASAGIQAPPGVATVQVICAGEVMLQQIGALPLDEAADQLIRPDAVVRPEWIDEVSSACALSRENTLLVLGQ